jgi:hypothetical protein
VGFPKGNGPTHRQERLKNCTKEEPQTRLCTNSIPDATKKGTEKEGRQGGESLLVCDMKGSVAVAWRALEEASKSDRQLNDFARGDDNLSASRW